MTARRSSRGQIPCVQLQQRSASYGNALGAGLLSAAERLRKMQAVPLSAFFLCTPGHSPDQACRVLPVGLISVRKSGARQHIDIRLIGDVGVDSPAHCSFSISSVIGLTPSVLKMAIYASMLLWSP
jgi:hypothetical protein